MDEDIIAYTAAQGALLALIRLSQALTLDQDLTVGVRSRNGFYVVWCGRSDGTRHITDSQDICDALHLAMDKLALHGVKDENK